MEETQGSDQAPETPATPEEVGPEQPQGIPDEQEMAETAPAETDYTRHVWLLVIILAVIVVAWLLSVMARRVPEGMREVQQTLPPPTAAVQAPAPRPAPPAQPSPARVSRVVGSGREVILARPPMALEAGGPLLQLQRLFDVTDRAPGFELGDLIRLPGRWADQGPVLALDRAPEPPLAPARDVQDLEPGATVAVIEVGGRRRAYPVETLALAAGVRDTLSDTPVFICWSPMTMAVRCLVADVDGRQMRWADSGLALRGGGVYYDEQTGSLWDAFSGVAVTGPMAGKRADTVPVILSTWKDLQAQSPDVSVLTVGLTALGQMPAQRLAAREAQNAYLLSCVLPFNAVHFQPDASPLFAKAFVLGVVVNGQARAYPLAQLAGAQETVVHDEVGGRPVEVHVTSASTAYAVSEGALLDAPAILWFAWKEHYPDTKLYQASAAAPATPKTTETGD